MNLCINCSHFELHPGSKDDPELGLCNRIPPATSLVTGLLLKSPTKFANIERLGSGCGKDAIYYVQKTTPEEINELLSGAPNHV